jgi:hypothetical protein
LCARPALLVADAFHALQPPGPERARRDAALADACLSVLRADGSVLIPTDTSGRALELLAALDAAWGERRLAGAYGLAFVSPVAASTVEFSRCLVEYASEGVRRAFERDRVNQLRPRHARLVASPGALAAAMAAGGGGGGADNDDEGGGGGGRGSRGAIAKKAPAAAKKPAATTTTTTKPMVVIASGGAGLEGGAARELFLSRWAADPRSAVLFASRPPEGSLGARLLAERAAPAGSRLKPPLPCRVAVWRREELTGEELAEHERARELRRAERRAEREAAAAARAAQQAQADAAAADAVALAAAADAAAAAAAAATAATGGTPHHRPGLGSASSTATTAALVDGFAPPADAAHAMFPDDDDALCAQWDAYGEVLDMEALRRAADLAGAEGAGLGGGGGGGSPGEAGAGAVAADGRRGGAGGRGGGPGAMSAAAQALARMAAIIGEDDDDDGGVDGDEESGEEESDEDDEAGAGRGGGGGGDGDGAMEAAEDGGGGSGAERRSERRPSSKQQRRRRLAAGAGATLAAAAAAMAAADKGGGFDASSSSSEDEDEDDGNADATATTNTTKAKRRTPADRPPPTKAVLREVDVPVATRVLPYVDYDGASDGRSLSAVLAQCAARCLAVAGGSRDATAALAFACLNEGQGRSGGGRVVTPGPGEAVGLALAPAYRVRVGAGVVARPLTAEEQAEAEAAVEGGADDAAGANNGGAGRPGGKLHAIGGYSLAWISGTLKALRVDPEEAAAGVVKEEEEEGSEMGAGAAGDGKKEDDADADAAMADVKAEEAGVTAGGDDAGAAAAVKKAEFKEPPLGLASATPLLPWPPARLALATGATDTAQPHHGGGGGGGGEGSVFIGDVRLSELRQALAAAGVASEFRAAPGGAAPGGAAGGAGGGVLACAGGVTVRRAPGGGELVVEGPLGDAYFAVRDVLYAQYSVC